MVSAIWARETKRCWSSSQIGWGYLISTQASAGMASIVVRTFLSIRIVTENRTPPRRAAAITLRKCNAESARRTISPPPGG